MLKPNPVGFHTSLTQDVLNRILECVPKVFMPRQVARMAKIHENNVIRWLKRGSEDFENGIESIFAQLWSEYNHILAIQVGNLLESIVKRRKFWQAPHELLKVIAREDFGSDSIEYKDLVDLYKKLLDSYKTLQESSSKRQGIDNAKEMDTESN